jgi:hypothetical protein
MPGGLNPAVLWHASEYGKGVFVAVGNNLNTTGNSASAWSLDGISWNEVLPAAGGLPDGSWYSVAFGNGIFVASQATRGPFGNGPGTAYSSDGKTWITDSDIPNSSNYIGYNICFSQNDNGGKFCVITYGASYSYTSTNGLNWTSQSFSPPRAYNYSQVVGGSDRYVVVGTSSDSGYSSMYLMFGESRWVTGADNLPSGFGITWFNSVAYSNGYFYTFEMTGTRMYSSVNGYEWVQKLTDLPFTVKDVAFDPNGNWVIVADNNIAYSDNPLGPYIESGPISVVTANAWLGVNFAGGKYITLGPSGSQGNGYSSDGIHWDIADGTQISFGTNPLLSDDTTMCNFGIIFCIILILRISSKTNVVILLLIALYLYSRIIACFKHPF